MSDSPEHPSDELRRVVAEHLPDYRVDSVRRLGEGQVNVAYLVNDSLIVRVNKEPDLERRAALVREEARLLTAVAKHTTLPVPTPRFVAPAAGVLAYDQLPGTPVRDLPTSQRPARAASIGAALGTLLGALHAVPVDEVRDLVAVDDAPLDEWRSEAAELFEEVRAEVPVRYHAAIDTFFKEPPPDGGYELVFSHNDLGIEHVLVEPASWTITGIIDWGDAAIDDPAYDFGLIYRDLGPVALDAALAAYQTGDHNGGDHNGGDQTGEMAGLRRRAVFYARCSVFEDVAHGLNTNQDAYLDNSRTALDWLFGG